MSAIKKQGLKIFFPMLLLLIFSCNKKIEKVSAKNPNDITFISLSNVGGSLGNYRIIRITRDSITLEQGIAARKTHREWNSAITSKTWKKLISSINVKTLDEIKSSPSKQSVDGIDETFQIKTPKKFHVYVNSYVDTIHYKQFENFKVQLEKILPKEYQ